MANTVPGGARRAARSRRVAFGPIESAWDDRRPRERMSSVLHEHTGPRACDARRIEGILPTSYAPVRVVVARDLEEIETTLASNHYAP